jgi:hypothetical protein
MHNYQVRPFSQYVVRTNIPVSTYLNVVNDYSSQALLTGFKNPVFRDNSHRFTRTINRIRQMERKPASLSSKEKALSALLEYNARMSSRCTPFGLFAGCTVRTTADETNIILGSPKFQAFYV